MKRIIGAIFFLMAFNLQAENFSYNNINISYSSVDLEIIPGFTISGNGLDLEANIEINKNIFIPLRYQSIGYDFDVDASSYLFGIGGHMPISSTVDVFGMLQLGNYELDVPPSFDDDVTALTVGMRTKFSSNEIMLYFTSISMDENFEDQSGIGAKLNVPLNKNTAITVRTEFLSDIETISIGAQFDF